MKRFAVIASSITYYKIEIKAKNEDEAYKIAKYDTDGSNFMKIGLNDWQIYDIDWQICNIQEIQKAIQ